MSHSSQSLGHYRQQTRLTKGQDNAIYQTQSK